MFRIKAADSRPVIIDHQLHLLLKLDDFQKMKSPPESPPMALSWNRKWVRLILPGKNLAELFPKQCSLLQETPSADSGQIPRRRTM